MMALTNQDRDELLVDLLEGLAHITAQLNLQNNLSSKVMRDKIAYYKEKLLAHGEDELPTRVGLGMYDEGDYVMINVGSNTYKGKIIGRINYDQAPGYKVMSLVDESEVWVVKEKDISKRIPTSMPPPPKNLPLPPKVPEIIDGEEIDMVSITENPIPKRKTTPPPPPKRKTSIPPPPPLFITDEDMEKMRKESREKVKAIEKIELKDLETLVK